MSIEQMTDGLLISYDDKYVVV